MIILITFVSLATIVTFYQPTYNVTEDNGPVQPQIVISKPSADEITVQVTSMDGMATGEYCSIVINCLLVLYWYDWYVTGGEDYESGPYPVVFTANVTRVPFNISITNDTMFEENENFTLAINSSSLPTGFSAGDPYRATVTIVDDDGRIFLWW